MSVYINNVMNYMKNKQLTAHTQSSMDHLQQMLDVVSNVEFERRKSLSYTFTHIFTVVNWRLCSEDDLVRRQTTKTKSIEIK